MPSVMTKSAGSIEVQKWLSGFLYGGACGVIDLMLTIRTTQ